MSHIHHQHHPHSQTHLQQLQIDYLQQYLQHLGYIQVHMVQTYFLLLHQLNIVAPYRMHPSKQQQLVYFHQRLHQLKSTLHPGHRLSLIHI